ncbi:Uncharacterized protein TCM_016140 [Theobroma cacao]|uniref:Uncharacterized protein n=1 Tax=Theobroma cacao TaxID=3641 RepID=A0A061G3X4_THECC|nr:Uncharacterized protein TCM_016140 [Theobroma cacao]
MTFKRGEFVGTMKLNAFPNNTVLSLQFPKDYRSNYETLTKTFHNKKKKEKETNCYEKPIYDVININFILYISLLSWYLNSTDIIPSTYLGWNSWGPQNYRIE